MDGKNRNTALASAFVEELARSGVREAVIAPGSRSTPLALALWREPAIEARVILDERSAGFFALGAAQATATPVAVLCTSGTAAANLHPAVCEADEAAVPLLVLTADRPPELRGIGAGQTIDQLKLYGDAVRWFCEVGTHDADDDGLLHMRATACRAFTAARGEPRPGPVHLNLAWRDPLGPESRETDVTATSKLALEGRGPAPLTVVPAAVPRLDDSALGELVERIARTPRGLIVAGRNPDPSLAAPLVALAGAAGYPVLAEPTSQIRCGPHSRELVIWPYDAIARAAPAALRPDLVVRIGDMPTSKALRRWLAGCEDAAQVVVDPDFGWNEPSRRAEVIARLDPAVLAAAAGELERLTGARGREPGWAELWTQAAEGAAAAIAAELGREGDPSEPAAHAALAAAYEDGDLVYTASSMPIRDQEAFLPSGPRDVLFLCNRGANGIDGLVSSGIGAAAASGRPTWILTGDLGLVHDMGALATLRAVEAAVRVVVLNNDGGGIFEFLPQAGQIERDEFEALFGTPSGLDLAKVAAAFGVPHRRVDDLGRLADAGRDTALIEIPVDRRANVALHHRIAEAAAAAAADAAPAPR